MQVQQSDIIDTSGLSRVVISLDATAAREAGALPAGISRLMKRLALGLAVTRQELAAVGLRVHDLVEVQCFDFGSAEDVERLQMSLDFPAHG